MLTNGIHRGIYETVDGGKPLEDFLRSLRAADADDFAAVWRDLQNCAIG
jgi:hypothetical protein